MKLNGHYISDAERIRLMIAIETEVSDEPFASDSRALSLLAIESAQLRTREIRQGAAQAVQAEHSHPSANLALA
jgi:hypothetical protein